MHALDFYSCKRHNISSVAEHCSVRRLITIEIGFVMASFAFICEWMCVYDYVRMCLNESVCVNDGFSTYIHVGEKKIYTVNHHHH